jgi:hypothetical protein
MPDIIYNILCTDVKADEMCGTFPEETKTKRVRTIALGDLAMEGVRLARKQYSERKMRSRPLFVDSSFVFIDEVGRALHPNAFTDAFRRVFVKPRKARSSPLHSPRSSPRAS